MARLDQPMAGGSPSHTIQTQEICVTLQAWPL